MFRIESSKLRDCGEQGRFRSSNQRGKREDKKAVRGETCSAKVTFLFTASGNKSDDAVLAAEGAFAFHTVKRTARVYYSKQYFLIL